MSLRDDAFDLGAVVLGDLPYAAYYPRVPVVAGGITVVCDLPVEWVSVVQPVPVTPGDGSAPFVTRFPRPLADKVRKKTCVEVPPVYAGHAVRARGHVGTTVEVGAIGVGHTRRIVDPLPGILVEEEELLVMLAAME